MENEDCWGEPIEITVSEKQLKRAFVQKHLGRLCTCKNRTVVLDYKNKRLECSECGAPIDPFDFLHELSMKEHMLWNQLKFMRQEKEELEKWMLNNRMGQTLRNIASYIRAGNIPCCPHCNEPFELEQIKSWTSKEYAIYLSQQKLLKKDN